MRFAVGIEYEGTRYYGWQRQDQDNLPTVQGMVEHALSQVANAPIAVIAAGRTDKGVHAAQQIFHFDTTVQRSLYAWQTGTNRYLPPDIRILWLSEVDADFHARFGALGRRYRYVLFNHRERPGLQRNFVSWVFPSLDFEKMAEAAQFLKGTHDFSALRGAGCQAKTTIRTIQEIKTHFKAPYFILDITANGFLLHMVRNIMGVLLEIGQCKKPVDWLPEVIDSQKRTMAGTTAPETGLYFVDAYYSEKYQLPKVKPGPWFLDLSFK